MRFCACLLMLAALLAGLPTVASAQYAAPRSPTVIRHAGAWHDYMYVPDGHCGCAMPVPCDNYAHCCPSCHFHPCCLLGRVGRILGALLPCNKCCGNNCLVGHGCGPIGHGAYGDPAGSCPSCASGVPPLSDPFKDDPMPPVPAPAPGADVRYHPAWKTTPTVTRDPAPHSQARRTAPSSKPRGLIARATQPTAVTARRAPATAIARPSSALQLRQQSVLRRTSADEDLPGEPARLVAEAEAEPLLQIDAEELPAADADFDADLVVPHNPLRK